MPEMWFRGFDLDAGVDQPDVIETSWTMVLVGLAVGLAVSSLLLFTLYRQRWYIRCPISNKEPIDYLYVVLDITCFARK